MVDGCARACAIRGACEFDDLCGRIGYCYPFRLCILGGLAMIALALFMLVYSWLLNRLVWIRLYIVIIYREQEPPRLFSLLSFGTLFRSPVLRAYSETLILVLN
jgi:hypothetical protein